MSASCRASAPLLKREAARMWEDRPSAWYKRPTESLRPPTGSLSRLRNKGHNRGSALGQAASLILEICWNTPVPELSLSELGLGSQPAQRTRRGWGNCSPFQPAASTFDSARLDQGLLILPPGAYFFFLPRPQASSLTYQVWLRVPGK